MTLVGSDLYYQLAPLGALFAVLYSVGVPVLAVGYAAALVTLWYAQSGRVAARLCRGRTDGAAGWLRAIRHGPAEWVWRRLAIGAPLAFRRTPAPMPWPPHES